MNLTRLLALLLLVGASAQAWAGPADIEGHTQLRFHGNRVTVQVANIRNNDNRPTSNPLYLKVWMTTTSTYGSGYNTAQLRLTGLRPGEYYQDIHRTLDYEAPPAGTYYIHLVTSNSATGGGIAYDVRTFSDAFRVGRGDDGGDGDDHGNSRSSATRVAVPSTTSGTIHDYDVDYFRFAVSRTTAILVETTGSLDTVGELFDANGESLLSEDDGGTGENFRMRRTLSAGTYYVKVASWNDLYTGDYMLHVRAESGDDDGDDGDGDDGDDGDDGGDALDNGPWPPAVPLMLPASDGFLQSFVRLINKSDQAGPVHIIARDDGNVGYDTVTVQLAARQTFHFNSSDLAYGNAAKGIEGIGPPLEGNWRLQIATILDVEVSSYVRTRDGFLTAMHELLPAGDGGYHVSFFNPASNTSQQSRLRLINWGEGYQTVRIDGVDDGGNRAGPVSLELPIGHARTLTAVDLEEGAAGLTGSLGNGRGKWQLNIRADVNSVAAQNLLYASSGHISNLSAEGLPRSWRVGDDHGDEEATATPLTFGVPQSGRLDSDQDVDFFRIELPREDGILTVYTTGSTDTWGFLHFPFGGDDDDDNGGEGRNFRIEYHYDYDPSVDDSYQERTWHVSVGHPLYPTATRTPGNYTIHAEFEPD